MTIDQPQANIELPEELKKAIEKSRNIVTVNQSEANRLGELIVSREYEIREQQKAQFDLEEKVKSLTSTAENLKESIASSNRELLEIEGRKNKASGELSLIQGSLLAVKNFLEEIQNGNKDTAN